MALTLHQINAAKEAKSSLAHENLAAQSRNPNTEAQTLTSHDRKTALHHSPTNANSRGRELNFIEEVFQGLSGEQSIKALEPHYLAKQEANLTALEANKKRLLQKLNENKNEENSAALIDELADEFNKFLVAEIKLHHELISDLEQYLSTNGNRRNATNYDTGLVARKLSKTLASSCLQKFSTSISSLDRKYGTSVSLKLNQDAYCNINCTAIGGRISPRIEALKSKKVEDEINWWQHNRTDPKAQQVPQVFTRSRALSWGAWIGDSLCGKEITIVCHNLIRRINDIDSSKLTASERAKKINAIVEELAFILEEKKSTDKEIDRLRNIAETIGIDSKVIKDISSAYQNLYSQIDLALGSVLTEKKVRIPLTLLIQKGDAQQIRRTKLKAELHGYINALSRVFTKQKFYELNQENQRLGMSQWQQEVFEEANKKYKADLESNDQNRIKKAEEALFEDIRVAMNEIKATSTVPFQLEIFGRVRGCTKAIENLLDKAIRATEANEIDNALTMLSSVFAGLDARTDIFSRKLAKDKKQTSAEDAQAALHIFEQCFQEPLINIARSNNCKNETLEAFFDKASKEKSSTEYQGLIKALEFVKKSMLDINLETSDNDKARTLQRTEIYGAYTYYLVLKYLQVKKENPESIKLTYEFAKQYLKPQFRKQIQLELKGQEHLIGKIDKQHLLRVKQLVAELEARIIDKATTDSDLKLYSKIYIDLERRIKKLNTSTEFAASTKARDYQLKGLANLIPAIYDRNKSIALDLLEVAKNSESYKALALHISQRLKKTESQLNLDTMLASAISKIQKSPVARLEKTGTYDRLRELGVLDSLERTDIRPDLKAALLKKVTLAKQLAEIDKLNDQAANLIARTEEADSIRNIIDLYEDINFIALHYPDKFEAIIQDQKLEKSLALAKANLLLIERDEDRGNKEIQDLVQRLIEARKNLNTRVLRQDFSRANISKQDVLNFTDPQSSAREKLLREPYGHLVLSE